MENNLITEFEFSDVEDVRIIVKAKGKNFGIVPKSTENREECKQIRIAMFYMLLESHFVVNTALEDISRKTPRNLTDAKTQEYIEREYSKAIK